MSKTVWGATIAGLAILGGIGFYLYRDELPTNLDIASAPPDDSIATLAPEAPPPIQYPVPETEPEQVSQAVDLIDSPPPGQSPVAIQAAPTAAPKAKKTQPRENGDQRLGRAILRLFDRQRIEQYLMPKGLVRRIVATVNSLDGAPIPPRAWPLRHVPGQYQVLAQSQGVYLSTPENGARYARYVGLLSEADPAELVSLYYRHYPLFQAAYENLGYPGRYFNDRLIEIIEHLLAAPENDAPLELIRPKVLYEYADPSLQARSSGHKIMMRIGPENAAVVKGKLSDIRTELIARALR